MCQFWFVWNFVAFIKVQVGFFSFVAVYSGKERLERTAALLALGHGEPQISLTPLLVSKKKKGAIPSKTPADFLTMSLTSHPPELMNNSRYWMHLITQLFENVLLERTFSYYSQLIRSYPPSHVFACWLLAGLVVVFNFQLVRTN